MNRFLPQQALHDQNSEEWAVFKKNIGAAGGGEGEAAFLQHERRLFFTFFREKMASFDENGRKYTPTKKAYKNESFINSSQVRFTTSPDLGYGGMPSTREKQASKNEAFVSPE